MPRYRFDVAGTFCGISERRTQLGNDLIKLGELNLALAQCPGLVQARVDRARALMRMDRNEEAVKDLQAAEKISPKEASIHFLLGQALRSLGRTAESKSEMDAFTKLEESARASTAQRAKQILENKAGTSPNY